MRITGPRKADPPTNERPLGVLFLAVLCFIPGAFAVYQTVGTLLRSAAGMLINPVAGIFLLLGMAISMAIAVGLFVIGRGLLKMRNWARVLTIGLAVAVALFFTIGILAMAASTVPLNGSELFKEITVIAVGVWAPIYLRKPQVKQAFGASSS